MAFEWIEVTSSVRGTLIEAVGKNWKARFLERMLDFLGLANKKELCLWSSFLKREFSRGLCGIRSDKGKNYRR